MLSELSSTRRPWLSLWITIHFFTMSICLIANANTSRLAGRIHKLLAPYSVALHQDYVAVPMHLSSGTALDHPHRLQYCLPSANNAEQWQSVVIDSPWLTKPLDSQWQNFQRMIAVVAEDKNEELVQLLFAQLISHLQAQQITPASVRLVRMPALSYADSQQQPAGELSKTALVPEVLFECRVVKLDAERIKLLPVLEQTRRAKSLEPTP